MKFEIVTRDNIDVDKWDHLILNSTNPRIYATSYYLDASTSSQWKAIIFSDYQAAIPLFEKKTLLFKYLAQPKLSQQLGLFILKEHFSQRNDFLLECLNLLTRVYKVGNLSLNEGNWIAFPKNVIVVPRTNFVLDLNRDYEKICGNYSKSHRRNLKKNQALTIVKEGVTFFEVIDFYKKNRGGKGPLKAKKINVIHRIFATLEERHLIRCYKVLDDQNQTIAAAIFVLYSDRITYIMGSSNLEGYNRNAMTLLIDSTIKDFANTNYYFDFEGSDVPGVRDFFVRFGPEEKKYPQLFWDNTAGVYSFVKKIKSQVVQ